MARENLTIDLGSFAPEFEKIAADSGFDEPAEMLRQHAMKLVSDARFDAMLTTRIVVTGAEADAHGAGTLQEAARRHGVPVCVAGESKHHKNKIFTPAHGWAFEGGEG